MMGFGTESPAWFGSLPADLQGRIEKLKEWLIEKLFNLGEDGFNNHLLGCARSLSQHFDEGELFTILRTCANAYSRPVEDREITKAVAVALDHSPNSPERRWPEYSAEAVAGIYASRGIKTLAELTERFSIEHEGTAEVLEELFPGDPLVCMGKTQKAIHTRKLSEHLRRDLKGWQFVVPSPMSKLLGKTKGGTDSARCLDNTGNREHLVIEFDKGNEGEQSACIENLATFAPLLMVVKSGGKSLHAWFPCRDMSEEDLWRFMAYAVTLGADFATFTKCQLVRTPGATRDNGNPQSVTVFRPFEADLEEWNLKNLPECLPAQIDENEKEILQTRNSFKLTHISNIEFATDANDFVERLLTKEGLSAIVAAPGMGKSFFMLDLAACVATGRNWRDRETEQAGVVYVCLEGLTGFKQRIHAFKRRKLLADDSRFHLLETPLNLLIQGDAQKLIEAINTQVSWPVGLIVIDTLSRSMPGANENSGEDMTKVISNGQEIQHGTGAHVSLVHHVGKDASKGARGHSSLNGAIDTEITLSLDSPSGVITATVTKQKDFECSGKFPFRLEKVELGLDEKLRPLSSCVVKHLAESQAPQRGRKAKHPPGRLLESLPVGSVKEWESKAKKGLGISKTTFYSLKRELTEDADFETNAKSGEIAKVVRTD